MQSNKYVLLVVIVTTNILGLLFYYSPLSLYGYWSDTLFLLAISIGTILLLKRIENKRIRSGLKTLCNVNFFAIVFTAFSIFKGIVPVHFIPNGQFQDKDSYAYFIERGDLGLTNGCYGEIQYHKKISWLPFLEIRYETNDCSSLDYESIVNGS